uniref:Pyridine nucleotide-disulfide oxidoreductase domain-containing protein 1 n=1 Tax=Steinernema glaseri TaxID=37863 RepID=A0A1I7YKC3_9BILA
MDPTNQPIVVVGGGVAGVCCVEEFRCHDEKTPVVLISGSSGYLKKSTTAVRYGEVTEEIRISEQEPEDFAKEGIDVLVNDVVEWIPSEKKVKLDNEQEISYSKLCICTGASAKKSFQSEYVLTLRDTETIERLREKLKTARRVLILGNGGIATELVFELTDVEIVWAIRHTTISATYFDEAAAKFFAPRLTSGRDSGDAKKEVRRERYVVAPSTSKEGKKPSGCALGPYWLRNLVYNKEGSGKERRVTVIDNVEGEEVSESRPEEATDQEAWNVWVKLSNNQWIGTDLVIQATGVDPNTSIWRQCEDLKLAEDGGIAVDSHMRTSIPDVYAAGDVCTPTWERSPHWMQMRLWTQARQMGMYVARCMAIGDVHLDICFDVFSHVTTYFGYKVIFLGDFNGANLNEPTALLRITPGIEFVKVLVKDGRIQGAVLVGETDIEETVENLILNQTDISQVEDRFLDPDIDIDDYFD